MHPRPRVFPRLCGALLCPAPTWPQSPLQPCVHVLVLALAPFFRLAGEAKRGKHFAAVMQPRALPSSAQPLARPLSFLFSLCSLVPPSRGPWRGASSQTGSSSAENASSVTLAQGPWTGGRRASFQCQLDSQRAADLMQVSILFALQFPHWEVGTDHVSPRSHHHPRPALSTC